MSFTAEPFFVPTDPTENVMKRLRNAGFNDADYKDCLINAVADYAPWQSTRLVLAVNPYRTTFGGSDDVAFTEQVMLACRNAIGERCVFDNHDLDSNLASPLVPLYAYMRQLGAEIEFQTQFATPADFPATIRLGVQQGASSIELYQEGVRLRRHCEARLKDAQARIEQIAFGSDGKPAGLKPFDAG